MPNWSACPVCEVVIDGDPWLTMDPLTWHRCGACDLVFKSKEPDGFLTDEHYEEDYFTGGSRQYDKRREHRIGKAQRQLDCGREFTTGDRLLDIGCSLGYALEAGRRLGLEPVGVDLSETARRACIEQGFTAVDGRLDALPFPDQSFDLVLMKHVLEHTPDPKGALHEIKRVCSDQACLIIAVPNLHYFKGRFARLKHRYYNPRHAGREHYVYFSRAALAKMLEEAGFTVRAHSKALFKKRRARDGLAAIIKEGLWFAVMSAWQALASGLSLRRELFVIAQLRNDP